MRQSGPRRLQIFCGNYKCAHSVVINADHWSDDVRLSDLEPKFTCQICGHRGADIRPLFERAKMELRPAKRVVWGSGPSPQANRK